MFDKFEIFGNNIYSNIQTPKVNSKATKAVIEIIF